MRRGAVRWELTVGASGGQPQIYTSLCLFKLKCLFFLRFLTSHYSIHTVQYPTQVPLCPNRSEENREVARFSYTNIQYLINMGGGLHSNTHTRTHTVHTLICTNGKTHVRVNASQHSGLMYKNLRH